MGEADLNSDVLIPTELRPPLGDVVAQLVERWPQDPMDSMTKVRIPSGAQEKFVRGFFSSENVVLTRCRCAPHPCVYARIRTYAR